MTYWYVSIRRAARHSGGPLIPLGFYGGVFIEVDSERIDSFTELHVIEALQRRYDFIPSSCQCEVHEISEMPPTAFRDRLLSREDLEALDRTEPLQ
jgi:hypothetical protein